MVYKFDIRTIKKITLKKMLKSVVLLILYINSKSRYNYLVSLGIIWKK